MKSPIPLLLIALLASCQKPIDERIADETRQWTQTNCPKTIDTLTRLDSMTYEIPTRTVQYHYSVSGEADQQGYWTTYHLRQALHKAEIAQQLRSNTEIKELVARRCNFEFIYKSASDGSHRYRLTITPADYQ